MDEKDINRYMALRLDRIVSRNEGPEIIIENPAEFERWCPVSGRWLSMVFGKYNDKY